GGGAIFNDVSGVSNILDSTFANNLAPLGGAIDNHAGQLVLVSSSVVANSATNAGGGLYLSKDALGMTGSILLKDTLVAGNVHGTTPNTTPNDTSTDSFASVNLASSYTLIGDAATAGGLRDKSADPSHGNLVGQAGQGTLPLRSVLNPAPIDNGGAT